LKTIRIELLIATLALLASAAASIATVIQTRQVADQWSASVWPYLTIENTLSDNSFRIDVINEGLGPAIVQSAALFVDGKRQADWRDAFRAIVEKDRRHVKEPSSVSEHDFGSTSVVRAGESVQIIAVATDVGRDFRTGNLPVPDLSVCYCSILQQCWTVDSVPPQQPKSVHDCGDEHATVEF
jgi:hypothetical protein